MRLFAKIKKYQLAILEVLVAFVFTGITLVIRFLYLRARIVMPAGDTFNFINAGTQLLSFSYPPTERRLPVFPILIDVFRYFVHDPVLAAKYVILIASALTVTCLYVIGRQLRIALSALAVPIFLAAIEPALLVAGVRPLADGLFITLLLAAISTTFYAISVKKPNYKHAIFLGFVLTVLALTRHEGVIIAAGLITWTAFYWRKHIKSIVLLCLSILVFASPWLILNIKVHGTPWYLSYSNEISGSGDMWGASSFGELQTRIQTMAENTYWASPWTIMSTATTSLQDGSLPADEFLQSTFSNPLWWLGLLAIIGILWLPVSRPKYGMLFVAVGVGYFLLLSWWGPTFRFSAPVIPFWILAIAGGLDLIHHILSRLVPVSAKIIAGLIVVGISFILIFNASEILIRKANGRATDNNGAGYAKLEAIRYTANLSGIIAVPRREGVYVAYFGDNTDQTYPPSRGVELERAKATSPEELRLFLLANNAKYFIHQEDDLPDLTSYLVKRHEANDVARFEPFNKEESATVVTELTFSEE